MRGFVWATWKKGDDVVSPLGGKIVSVECVAIVGQLVDARLTQGVWV